MRRATVDIGSNSVLLLIAEPDGTGWHPIYESSNVTGLGKGTKQTGMLQPDGMARTLEQLVICRNKAAEYQAEIRYVGTMALRIASNKSDFLQSCLQNAIDVEIISGDQEAAFGFEAIVNDPTFHMLSPISILDPGGHSTELVTANFQDQEWSVKYKHSFPIGALGLCETHLADESPSLQQRLDAVLWLDEMIEANPPVDDHGTLVVLGATATNLVSIREKWAEWKPNEVHGSSLDYEEISRAAGWLCDLSLKERSKIIGLEPGREGSLHAGALILERFLYALRAESCLVSTHGWRHAFLAQWPERTISQ